MPNAKTATKLKAAAVSPGVKASGFPGICATCNRAYGCPHRQRNPSFAIWDCEDFDDYVYFGVAPDEGGSSEVVPAPRVSRRVEFDAAEYRGLCTNCEVRDGCTCPRPAGGVWHCELYQ
jgi:hypothetical protein